MAFKEEATAIIMSSKAAVIPRAMAIGLGDTRVNRKVIPASTVVLVISQRIALPGVKSASTATRKTTSHIVARDLLHIHKAMDLTVVRTS